jgi:hypothetical protein
MEVFLPGEGGEIVVLQETTGFCYLEEPATTRGSVPAVTSPYQPGTRMGATIHINKGMVLKFIV